jgi:hypothetical protein
MHVIRAIVLCTVAFPAFVAAAQALEVTNNQSFDIRQPVLVRGMKADASGAAQQVGDDAVVIVEVPASGSARPLEHKPAAASKTPTAMPGEDGIAIRYGEKDLGKLSWDILVENIDKTPSDEEASQTKRNFDGLFNAQKITFKSVNKGALFETFAGEMNKEGLKLAVSLDVYPAGFVDVRATFTNESEYRTKVYAAVLTRWEQPHAASRSVNYDNHIAPLEDGGSTPFRAGVGRHLFVQRGVDWINMGFEGAAVAWMNDFAPSFTSHKPATAKSPAKWIGANLPHLGQEAMVVGGKLYSITEIARPSIKSYRGRLDDNILPGKDQPLTFTSRLVFSSDARTDERVDQDFIAYTGFNPQKQDGETTRVSFGVKYVKFGTAYFPYSTLGENFEKWHMPGQMKETYWPLSADTVTQYKLFADDIKRDLRIAKAMGFESIRLHHLEEIARLDKAVQDEYLDFLFAEFKHLGLTALLDVKLPTARVVELVKKYRPQVDGVEIDNEVLIFGINDNEVQYWKDTYNAVKEVAPDMPVWLTGHTNTGAFERLRKLGVPFDKVGAHAYMDAVDAIPSGRDYALAVANYASEIGKEPTITEWNWRFLTRMTPEDRAKIYPPIYENILKTHCMPLLYQFQLQESLAMTTKSLRGIRHYEQLNLSRRLRPEALEFMRLIKKYSDPGLPQNILSNDFRHTLDIGPAAKADESVMLTVTNTSDREFSVTATPEGPQGVELRIDGDNTFKVPGKSSQNYKLHFKIPDSALPGFYHFFVRLDAGNGLISYAMFEVRRNGMIQFDKDKGVHPEVTYSGDALDYDFNRDIAIVYADEAKDQANRWDVESAWLLYQTLESATGRPVKIFQLQDLPADLRKSGNLIVVGMPGNHELIKSIMSDVSPQGTSWVARAKANDAHGDWLIVAGEDEGTLNLSAIDLTLRYWLHAKDSGARRVPLTDKPIEKGPDPSVLP